METLSGKLLDMDLTPANKWIGVVGREGNQALVFGDRTVNIPRPCRFPIVRALGSEAAVVVDSRVKEPETENAWIIQASGNVKTRFAVGDGIQDVLVRDNWIVVTYFDEGIFKGIKPGDEGIAVFDIKGNLKFGYRSYFGNQAVGVSDCYCACWGMGSVLFFLPYTDFPLVAIDLNTMTQKVWTIPDELHGSNAVTAIGQTLFFHSPYSHKDEILMWQIGSKPPSFIGKHSGPLRGLVEGRFLSVGENAYTVISAAINENIS